MISGANFCNSIVMMCDEDFFEVFFSHGDAMIIPKILCLSWTFEVHFGVGM